MTFDQAVQLVLKSEGGYTNDPNDAGGETNYGITVAVARKYGYNGPMRELPLATAIAIYKRKYWDANQVDKYPDHLKYPLFDAFVNMGYNAIGVLSVAAGLPWKNQYTKTSDGTNDSNITYWDDAAMQRIAKSVTVDQFIDARKQFYIDLVKRKPNQQYNLKGWLNRMDDVKNSALKFLSENPAVGIVALLVPLGVIGLTIFFLTRKNKKG